jgi:hypothetical protein
MSGEEDTAEELKQLQSLIQQLQQLLGKGEADKEDKALLCQYLVKEARLQPQLQQGKCCQTI